MRNFLSESVSSVMHDLKFHYDKDRLKDVTGDELDVLYAGTEFVIAGKIADFNHNAIAKRPKREDIFTLEAQVIISYAIYE